MSAQFLFQFAELATSRHANDLRTIWTVLALVCTLQSACQTSIELLTKSIILSGEHHNNNVIVRITVFFTLELRSVFVAHVSRAYSKQLLIRPCKPQRKVQFIYSWNIILGCLVAFPHYFSL